MSQEIDATSGAEGQAPIVKEIWYVRPLRITAKYGRCVFCNRDVTGQAVVWFKEGFIKNGVVIVGKDAEGHGGVVICVECMEKAQVVIKDEYSDRYNLVDHEPMYVAIDENLASEKIEQERKFLENQLPSTIQYPTSFKIQRLSDIVKETRRK